MGIIYRATDTVLGREVAVKVLHDKYTPASGVARRFADEARITAQLQHPAIPPVHDLGTLPAGRPFLAMKLIKGETLEDLLAPRPDPSADLGRLVAVFEHVCQAIAYAHAHDVIHRDLKPANVMVGAFGEVQVMDWGLAKVLASREHKRPESDPEETRAGTTVVSQRDTDEAFTQAGSVLGTPAFMPPEQAAGAVGTVDRRSDVFGLGAILAVILTGKPPFTAPSGEATRVKAAQGDVTECLARLDGCGAEPDLVNLCKRCLSPRSEDRPADGAAVAEAVAGLRQAAEERARSAELERVRAEGERLAAELRAAEGRKRRRAQRALAGAVALLLLGGLAFGWWQAEQGRAAREREARNAEAVAGLLGQCEQALGRGNAAAAAVTLEAAEKRAAEGGAADQADRLVRCRDDLALLKGLDAVDQFFWTIQGGKFPLAEAVAARYREVLAKRGVDPEAIGAEAAAAQEAGSAVRGRLVAAWDRLLSMRPSAALRAALRTADPDSFRDQVRDAVGSGDRKTLARLIGQPAALAQPAGFAAFLGEQRGNWTRRRALLRAALRRRPGDVGLLMGLGAGYPIGRPEGAQERARWFQAAVAVAPDNFAAQINLGVALRDKKDFDGAMAHFQEALRIDPSSALAHFNLGIVRRLKGDPGGAIAEYKQALRHDPKYARAHINLGSLLREKGDLDGAIAHFQEAIRIDPKFALAQTNLGIALEAKGDLDGAIAHFQEALGIDPKYHSAHYNLGRALYAKGDLDGAIAHYQKAVRLAPQSAPDHTNLAIGLQGKGDLDGAIRHYREALRLDPRLANAQNGLGDVLLAKGELDEAIAHYRQALRLDPKSAYAHQSMGNALFAKGDLDGAIAHFGEAIQLGAESALAHTNLGNALFAKGNLDEAIAHYRRALRLDPKFAPALMSLPRTQRMRELLPRLPDVLTGKQKPKNPVEACALADLCAQPFQKRYAEAARLYTDAFAADPRLAEDLTLGHRYNAACCAVLAGCGHGRQTTPLEEKEKARLRALALAWLRSDLALLRRQARSGEAAQCREAAATLTHWLGDPDLEGVRPGPKRVRLSAVERAAWDALWADVQATLARAHQRSRRE
jgi:tetratricopeptide (TPR) repeat protein